MSTSALQTFVRRSPIHALVVGPPVKGPIDDGSPQQFKCARGRSEICLRDWVVKRALVLSLPGLILAVISGSLFYLLMRTSLAIGSGLIAETIDGYESRWVSTTFLLASNVVTGVALRRLGLL